VNQNLALEVMLSGESVLLTGPAGTGKTFVLNNFIQHAKAGGKHVSVTATTGLASTHLGGNTIHSWSGIGISDTLPSGFAENVSKARREVIEKTDVLLIDEISMLHDFRLDMIDEACRLVRRRDEPFGGIQVIMSGDFFQLPPVNRSGSRGGGFVVGSDSWRELDPTILYLSDQYRQDQGDLLGILDALRSGDIRRHHAEALLNRSEVEPPDDNITELHTVNIDVDSLNAKRLSQLESEEMVYSQVTTGAKNYVQSLQRSVLVPPNLVLKRGALVMAVKNSPTRIYVNGSVGVVVDFEPGTGYPVVEFKNGKTVSVTPESWELRDGEKKRASITQVPLRLAWAITVHKSQGMTLDAAKIDLRKAFVPGMGYVALSRVRSLENLYLYGINRTALEVSGDALEIDKVLRNKADDDYRKFAHLQESAEKRAKEIIDLKSRGRLSGSSWSEKLARMRKTHPNAYRAWSSQDDATLKQRFLNGHNVEDIAKELGRHEGSILKRIEKHFGEGGVVT
jgi:ATP-dependent exoDNAse (exonuclease V) alpha subunit